MRRAGRDLFEAKAACGKDVPAHRLMIPTSANLTTFISCRDCRAALCYPKDMHPRVKEGE
jgi:hypothetical protein